MKNISVKYKILSFLILLIVTLMVLTTKFHSSRMTELVLSSAADVQTKFTSQIGFSLSEPLDYDLSDEVERLIFKARKENPEVKYIYVYNREGAVINQYGLAPKVNISNIFEKADSTIQKKVKGSDFLVEYFHPIKINGLTRFYLRIGYDNTKYEGHIDQIISDYIKIIYAVVVFILIIGYFFFKNILFTPLSSLLEEMRGAQREFTDDEGYGLSGKNEISYLRDYFNYLIVSIRTKNFQLKDLNTNLEKKVEERTEELKNAQAKLLESAHMAGMATMAAGVLHNIGNILTLASNCAENIRKLIEKSSIPLFSKIEEHAELLDEKSKPSDHLNVLHAYKELSKQIRNEHLDLKKQTDTLIRANRTMLKTVQSQQKYAKVGDFLIEVKIDDIVKDSIQLMSESLGKHRINIHFDTDDIKPIVANKANLLNVFVNLLLNAKESILQSKNINNPMDIHISLSECSNGEIRISYTDSGIGMSEETLESLFKFGFSTKEKGSGFGLHDAANTIKEIGGNIMAFSDGEDLGATFVISIPRDC